MSLWSARAFLYGLLAASGPLAVVATVLKDRTHHRQLGAVTFAFLAAVILFVAVSAARRSTVPSSPGWVRAGILVMSGLSASIAVLFSLAPGGLFG